MLRIVIMGWTLLAKGISPKMRWSLYLQPGGAPVQGPNGVEVGETELSNKTGKTTALVVCSNA